MFGTRIHYSTAMEKYKLTKTELQRLIMDFGISTAYGKNYTEENSLYIAVNFMAMYDVYLQYRNNTSISYSEKWKQTYSQEQLAYTISFLPEIIEGESMLIKLSERVRQQIAMLERALEFSKTGVIAKPEPKQELKINKGKELEAIPKGAFAGGKIRVYCKACRTEGKTYETSVNKCKHGLEEKYYVVRLYVPEIAEQPKKKLAARYKNDAITEANILLTNFRQSSFNSYEALPVKKEDKIEYLHQAIDSYIAFKKNDSDRIIDDGYKHTPSYLSEVERALGVLKNTLKGMGYAHIKLTEFENSEILREFYAKLRTETLPEFDAKGRRFPEEKVGQLRYSGVTINKYTRIYSSMFIYLNTKKKLNVYNPFSSEDVRISVKKDPKAMNEREFIMLLQYLGTKPEINDPRKKVTTEDVSWLLLALSMQATYGVRREDICELKWSDITNYEGVYLIGFTNHKKTRLTRAAEPIKDYFPLEKHIAKLLKERGYPGKVGTDDYIILGKEEQAARRKPIESRAYVLDKLTVGFTLFCRTLFGDNYKLTNKSIRKSNLTDVRWTFGDKAHEVSRHSSTTVLDDHYVDKKELALKRAKNNPNVVRA